MSNLRVACSWLGQIYAGRISKDRLNFVGTKTDVTSDCIKAVCENFEDKGTQIVHAGGKPVYEIKVVKIQECGYTTEELRALS